MSQRASALRRVGVVKTPRPPPTKQAFEHRGVQEELPAQRKHGLAESKQCFPNFILVNIVYKTLSAAILSYVLELADQLTDLGLQGLFAFIQLRRRLIPLVCYFHQCAVVVVEVSGDSYLQRCAARRITSTPTHNEPQPTPVECQVV